MRVRKQTGSDWTEYGVFMRAPRPTASPSRWARADRRSLRAHPCGSEVIAEKDQADAWTDYIFAGGKRVAKAPGVASTSGTEDYSRGPQRLPPLGWRGDHLGSARLMTDASGNVVANSEATMLPYGQQYETAVGTNHYKFTGKERDGESGLDNVGARYLGSNMGRFMSVDPDQISGFTYMDDPQSWNAYSYVRNSPLNHIDPDGMKYRICDEHGENCSDVSDPAFDKTRKDAQRAGEVWKNGTIYVKDEDGNFQIKGSYHQTDVDTPGATALAGPQTSGLWRQSQYTVNALGVATGVVVAAPVVVEGVAAAQASYLAQQTLHGAMVLGDPARLGIIGAGLTTLFKTAQYVQTNGCIVTVRALSNGKFDVVIKNQAGQIVNAWKNLDAKALEGLARNYGWH